MTIFQDSPVRNGMIAVSDKRDHGRRLIGKLSLHHAFPITIKLLEKLEHTGGHSYVTGTYI